ncbi:aldo/keto reductase [Pseudomonas sp. NA-150]|uniref:aldo/keto reductase n=1 Tax=Pseudomonas sp. NA-150 TaxID=3367525 RepID=UPI0037CB1EE2
MDYVNLGPTGLKVSRLCLDCMTYGAAYADKRPWTMAEEPSRVLIRQALDSGINFLSTASSYSAGASEEFLGRAIKDFARRGEIVLATKVYIPWDNKPNAGGLSRKAIFKAIDDSLRRLGTDYVDLYQIHRWDYSTPIEETLEALHDIVKAGKVRYIGASSMYAWQFAKAFNISDLYGWTRFVTMQNQVNLLSRVDERGLLPLCKAEFLGVMPKGSQARGRLTHDWRENMERAQTDDYASRLYNDSEEGDRMIIEAVAAVAAARNVPRAQIALSLLLTKSEVSAPIIVASKTCHLEDAVAALSVKLTADEIRSMEAPYRITQCTPAQKLNMTR